MKNSGCLGSFYNLQKFVLDFYFRLMNSRRIVLTTYYRFGNVWFHRYHTWKLQIHIYSIYTALKLLLLTWKVVCNMHEPLQGPYIFTNRKFLASRFLVHDDIYFFIQVILLLYVKCVYTKGLLSPILISTTVQYWIRYSHLITLIFQRRIKIAEDQGGESSWFWNWIKTGLSRKRSTCNGFDF